MASKSRIQGITISLDGETSGLQKALQDVNKRTISLQSELRDVEKLLKFDPDNVELLAQKQQLLTQQIENTNEKLSRLKKVYDQVEQQAKSGEIGEDRFRAFQREIAQTEQQLRGFQTRLDKINPSQVDDVRNSFNQLEESVNNASEETKGLVDNLGGLVAGAASVAGIGEIVEKSLDISSLNTKIDVSFNVPDESIESVKSASLQVQNYGIDAEEALEGVRRQWALNKDASDEANEQTVKYASTLASAYSGVDFTEIIQESSELSKILGINTDEAVALMDTLIEMGFPPDQIDIIAEYGTQLQRMGYTAEQVMGMFASGVATGTHNIDQLIDGVKEGRIVMAEFGATIDEETATLINSVGISTEQFQSWGKAIAEGGSGGKQAMEEVATALLNIEDKTLQNQLGVKVYGTLFEEQGSNIINAILGVNDHMLDMGGMIDTINEKTDSMDKDPTVRMRKALNDLTVALTPAMEKIAEFVGGLAEWVSENPKLASAIAVIVGVLGILAGIFAVIAPIVTTLSTLWPVLAAGIGLISAPVLGVVAAIAGLIAVGVALWQNWDVIKAKAIEIWENIKVFFAETWDNIKTKASEMWESFKITIVNVWEGIKSFFTETVPQIINNIINWFKELPYKVGYELGQLLGNIIKWGLDTWNYLQTNVPIWIEGVVTFFSELPGKIWNWLVNAYNNIVDWGQQTYNNMVNTIRNTVNSVIEWFSTLPSKIWTWLSSTISKVIEFATDLRSRASEAGTNFVNTIINAVTGLPSRMREIGSNIVQGVWEGISGMWSWFTDKVSNFFTGIVDGVKDVLGIHSPSRVFMELGGFTAEGFANGIDNMKKAVSKAGQDMANSAIPSIPKVNSAINEVNNQPTIVYLTTENYMDSKLIGSHTTKNVISNMNRSSRNYKIGKGGLGYV